MTKSYTIFQNPGEIDIRAIKTFGVSSKESENPFGYFGTGLKIAIGILLRNKQEVTIQIGLKTYTFGLVSARIRVDDFDIVTMNGEELGFTSQVGKDWKLWMAYRELYCNAIDEYGESFSAYEMPEPTENMTRVIVKGEAFARVHLERDEFILSTEPLEYFEDVEIHQSSRPGVFYRGIRVGQLAYGDKASLFTYNMKKTLMLTENRTLAYVFQVRERVGNVILESKNEDTIRKILLAPETHAEHDLEFAGAPGETFMRVVSELYKNKGVQFNLSALRLLKRHSKEDLSPRSTELNLVERKQLEKAIAFCQELDFPVDNREIIVTDTLGKDVLGLAGANKIYLSREAFDMGTKIVAGTLIEEYIHLQYHHADCTRSMQNFLFNKIISLGELLAGEPL